MYAFSIRFLMLTFFTFFGLQLFSQDWMQVQRFGGAGSESLTGLTSDQHGGYWASGTFTGETDFQDQTFQSLGDADLWLAHINDQQQLQFFLTAGSPWEEEVVDLRYLGDDQLLWTGYFFREITVAGTKIQAPNASKAIFLVWMNTQGQVLQHLVISGTGLKEIGKPSIRPDGELLLTGFFGSSLSFADQTITAKAQEDAFVVWLNQDGTVKRLIHFGEEGMVRGKGGVFLEDGSVLVGGNFQGKLALGTDTLLTSTPDADLFFARFDSMGRAVWLKAAGGVYEALLEEVLMDHAGNILFAGNHRGVVRFEDGTQIQTSGLNDNFFAGSMTPDGSVNWVRSFGSTQNEFLSQMKLVNQTLLISGFFSASFQVDQEFLPFQSGFTSAFLLGFDAKSGVARWSVPIRGDGFVLGSNVGSDTSGTIWWGGSFTGKIRIDDEEFSSMGLYDIFIGGLDQGLTSLGSVAASLEWNVFPNPSRGIFQVSKTDLDFLFRVFDANGREVLSGQNYHQIDLTGHPSGNYFLVVWPQDRASSFGPIVLKLVLY